MEGTVALWQVDAHLHFEAQGLRCCFMRGDELLAEVELVTTPLGTVWRISFPGRSPRTYRSIVPALACLREALCPERAPGRVLFVANDVPRESAPR